MFNVVETPVFTRDVSVEVPHEDGYQTQTLRTKYRMVDTAAFNGAPIPAMEAMLEAAVVEFYDLCDESKKPIDCTPDIKTRLIKRADVRIALYRAYFDALTGAKRGN